MATSRFVGADALIGELSRAAAKGRLETALLPFLHPHVLVIDELGYLSHAPDAANVPFTDIEEDLNFPMPSRAFAWR